MLSELTKSQKRYGFIGDVRGKGLMIGLEIVKDRKTREPASDLRNRIVQTCFQKGLLILGTGDTGIRFSPALVMTREEASAALNIFFDVLNGM